MISVPDKETNSFLGPGNRQEPCCPTPPCSWPLCDFSRSSRVLSPTSPTLLLAPNFVFLAAAVFFFPLRPFFFTVCFRGFHFPPPSRTIYLPLPYSARLHTICSVLTPSRLHFLPFSPTPSFFHPRNPVNSISIWGFSIINVPHLHVRGYSLATNISPPTSVPPSCAFLGRLPQYKKLFFLGFTPAPFSYPGSCSQL